jgi:hypothetical protein
MRNYLQALRRHLGVASVYRPTHIADGHTSVWALRLGIPLGLAAVSALGWYLSSLKPTTATAAAHVTSSSQDTSHTGDASVNAKLEATPDVTNESTMKTNLTINSESVPIPENGSVHRVIQDDSGTTTLDVSVDSQTTGDSETSTTMNLEINSHSSTEFDQSVHTEKGP